MTVELNALGDVADLAAAICDIESVSGDERELADAVEQILRGCPHLSVVRNGDAVIARTELGREQRVVVAGHLDTVPISPRTRNFPSTREVRADGEWIVGRGAIDMKGGVAVQLALAVTLTAPTKDVTWVFYDHEEVEATKNGLARLVRDDPAALAADFAVLGEPTCGGVEGGCNGTLRMSVTTNGVAAHSARAWMGVNAIHAMTPVLARLGAYVPATVAVDGLDYRESLGAVLIDGGTAANVVPDRCAVTVNYRFAPSKSVDDAIAHVTDLFGGLDVELAVLDSAPGARPGLDQPIAQDFVAAVGEHVDRPVAAKEGWTDVARFSALGIPAVNFGPGDPLAAHSDGEAVLAEEIRRCHAALREWLS